MDVTAKVWPHRVLLGGGGVAIGAAAALALGLGWFGPSAAPPANAGAARPASAVAAPPPPATAPVSPEVATARHALLLRLRNPDAARLTDVAMYRFGPEDERAVCGTVASTEIPGGAARFVVRLVLPRAPADSMVRDGGLGQQRPPLAIVEDGPGVLRPAPEAARRYCREAAPVVAAATNGSALAGAPARPGTAEGGGAAAPVAPARARMVVQSAANVRAAPGGAVLSVVPRGRVLQVFERAPGGWVRVGEGDEPAGWVHTSLLADAPTTLSVAQQQ